MTKTDTIDTLIDRLNELQFEQTETIRRIAELRKEEECQQTLKTESEEVSLDNEPDQDSIPSVVTSVRKNNDNYYWEYAPSGTADDIFKEGTRVYITNKVTPSKKGVRDEKDHCATVKHVDHHHRDIRIYFVTDNGLNTWRLPKYLGLLRTTVERSVRVKTEKY